MGEHIVLAYGKTVVALKCRTRPDRYAVRDPECMMDAPRFSRRVSAFLSAANLDLTRPAVVVADKTRLCGYPHYLPVLLELLCKYGAAREAICLYIAYGTHAAQKKVESRAAYGPAFDDYRWVHHRCEGDHFVDLARTARGTPVVMSRDIMAASSVITFGAVSHHYFAGFGGGRKLLFPGLGQKAAIYANHSLFLDTAHRRLAAGCRPGALDGNPLAEDLAEVEVFRPADMAIHGILDSGGRVCDLLVGQGVAHFRAACAMHARNCEAAPLRRYDLVVASAGGFPKDLNFIQSHKAIHHAADFVCDGGRLVVLAQCRDGVGSDTFLPWFALGGWDAAFDRLAAEYAGNGGTALAMMDKLKRIRISLVTDLDTPLTECIGVDRWSAEQAQQCLDNHQGPWALIPNASMLVHRSTGSRQ